MSSSHQPCRPQPQTSRRKLIGHHYEPRLEAPSLANHEILDWASVRSQEARFAVLAQFVGLHGKSLLDVGCGLGDLYSFLQRSNIKVQYTGVDILEKMVEAARLRHPGARFVHADIFTSSPFEPESFDVVFCSGAFNLNLGNNLEFLPSAVRTMLGLSRRDVVFNLLHRRAATAEARYYYFDPDDVQKMLAGLDCQVRMIDDYLDNDFTVICQKKAAGPSQQPAAGNDRPPAGTNGRQ